MEKIICAAIWYKDGIFRDHSPKNVDNGIVVCGRRHHNCFMTLKEIFEKRDYILKNLDGEQTIQGFITTTNRFVDRYEGGTIAFSANQISEPKKLYSEDLY